jgi:putative DNA primase/helicase
MTSFSDPIGHVASLTVEQIAHGLGGRKSPAGWMARCPSHDDSKPSLSLTERDGRILVKCHAGCAQSAVIAALKAKGLWPERKARLPRRIVAEYDYRDEDGELLYQVVRLENKQFFQRRPDPYGGWINKKGERQILYRLREVLEAPIVFVVEGEKDVETLREYGFVATMNAGGAKAPWLPQFTEALRGREVILIPDNDPPGRARVLSISQALVRNAAVVTVLVLERAKDVSEWFAQGHSELELITLVESQEVAK